MNQEDIRLECLRLALPRVAAYAVDEEVTETARKYVDFVNGEEDAKIIAAARELAKKVA